MRRSHSQIGLADLFLKILIDPLHPRSHFMNKAEFVEAVAEKTGTSKSDAAKSVDAFMAVVSEALAKGEEIRLPGFGTFQTVDRAASEGRNPRTGEKISIPATTQPKFKAGTELKRAVLGDRQA
jgi:DNA-binding protein HU-beta